MTRLGRTTLACLLLSAAALITAQNVRATEHAPPSLRGGFEDISSGPGSTRADAGIVEISDPVTVILTVINMALALTAAIATAMLIWAGVSYIISAGDEDKLQKAKQIILYTIIGLMVIGMAAIVVNLVLNIFTSS